MNDDLSATDRCVKCGLCLPHCPTFIATGNEADSPRGRISLMQSIDETGFEASKGLFKHLDQCLQCRACEAMCPSKVPFGALMDKAKSRLEPLRKTPLKQRLLRALAFNTLGSRLALDSLATTLLVYQKLGLHRLMARLPLTPSFLKRPLSLLPTIRFASLKTAGRGNFPRGTVNLFTACASRLFDRQTLAASIQLLEALGYRVEISKTQRCCGALHQHSAEHDAARRLAKINRKAFAANSHPIVSTASGCTAHLADYSSLLAIDGVSERVSDIVHFILGEDTGPLSFQPLEQTVAVYIPCTHRNALKQSGDIASLLQRIPGINTYIVNPQGGCCGAAGSYMLSQPALSDQLRQTVVEVIADSGAKQIVTTNIGCAIQLEAGLRAHSIETEVIHPITLLNRQLKAG